MARHSIVLVTALLAALAFGGCKGETVVKPDPQTQQDLDACKKTSDEKDKRISALESQSAELMRNGSGAEIVVSIEGTALTVKPGKAGEVRPVDDKIVAAASKDFINVVAKSRGAIQKCYEQALKKNTGLQAKTVTLTVSASFAPTGAYQTSNFAATQPLGDTFDNCIKSVASHWALSPTNSPAMTFKAQVSLTPS